MGIFQDIIINHHKSNLATFLRDSKSCVAYLKYTPSNSLYKQY